MPLYREKPTVFIVICFLLQVNGYLVFEKESSSQISNTIATNSTASETGVNRFISTLLGLTGLGGNNGRGPSHDTPPTPCRCSKY